MIKRQHKEESTVKDCEQHDCHIELRQHCLSKLKNSHDFLLIE